MRHLHILRYCDFPFFTAQQMGTATAIPARSLRRNRLLITLSALLILVLIGSGLGVYFTFFSNHPSTPAATVPSIAGYAYFVSSGLVSTNLDSNQGITDELQITLKNIPSPRTGKSYYAWLLNEKNLEWNPLALGQLNVNNDVAVLSYGGDAEHTNLLATDSRFFITEEDATTLPVNPSQDAKALVYYSEFSQIPNLADPKRFSLYDHIRHLLANDPGL